VTSQTKLEELGKRPELGARLIHGKTSKIDLRKRKRLLMKMINYC